MAAAMVWVVETGTPGWVAKEQRHGASGLGAKARQRHFGVALEKIEKPLLFGHQGPNQRP